MKYVNNFLKAYGFILYRTILPQSCSVCLLNVTGVRDRGQVFVNNVSFVVHISFNKRSKNFLPYWSFTELYLTSCGAFVVTLVVFYINTIF